MLFRQPRPGLIDPETGLSRDLLDAVIRFNNTNPDYKVEIQKLDFDAGGQRDKRLIELATGSGIDILDTAGLPELSLDSGLNVFASEDMSYGIKEISVPVGGNAEMTVYTKINESLTN